MVTELFPLTLEFRGLSDEDPDEITIDSPDEDVDEDEDEDPLKGDDDTKIPSPFRLGIRITAKRRGDFCYSGKREEKEGEMKDTRKARKEVK